MHLYLKRVILFLCAALIGFTLFKQGVPIPYMLGGIISAMIVRFFIDKTLSWPRIWRDYALLAAGYGIGRNFTMDTLHAVMLQSMGIFEACFCGLGFSILIAYITARHSFANLISCVMGMLPGGLTTMMLMSEEDERCDANVVMVMQTLRMFSVVFSVPFLVVYGLGAKVLPEDQIAKTMTVANGYHWLIFIPLGIVGWYLGKKIKLPAARIIGPVIMAAIFSCAVHPVNAIPSPFMAFAQLNIGLVMGGQLDRDRLVRTCSLLPHIILGSLGLVAVSVFVALHLSHLYGFSLITAFLAMAPGGITEMCLAGLSMGEDVSIILTYQLARMFLIAFFVPVAIRWWFSNHSVD